MDSLDDVIDAGLNVLFEEGHQILLFSGWSIVDPLLPERHVAKVLWVDIDHAAARDGGGGCELEVVHLQHTQFSLSLLLLSNNKDFLCANMLEDQAQWCDKTKGLCKLVIINNALRRIGSIREIGF